MWTLTAYYGKRTYVYRDLSDRVMRATRQFIESEGGIAVATRQ